MTSSILTFGTVSTQSTLDTHNGFRDLGLHIDIPGWQKVSAEFWSYQIVSSFCIH